MKIEIESLKKQRIRAGFDVEAVTMRLMTKRMRLYQRKLMELVAVYNEGGPEEVGFGSKRLTKVAMVVSVGKRDKRLVYGQEANGQGLGTLT